MADWREISTARYTTTFELLAGATAMLQHLDLADVSAFVQGAIEVTTDRRKLAVARRQLALIEAARSYLRTVALIEEAPL